jgi:hypothetical protein
MFNTDNSIMKNTYPLYSMDINNDGIIEVGIQTEPLYAGDYSLAGMPWINNWYQWDNNDGLMKVMEEYSNYNEDYSFIIPESWSNKILIDKVTDKNSKVKSEIFKYMFDNKEQVELLVLHNISKDTWSIVEKEFKQNNQPYVLFGENNENMLVAELKQCNKNLSGDNFIEYEKLLLDRESFLNRIELIGNSTKIKMESVFPKSIDLKYEEIELKDIMEVDDLSGLNKIEDRKFGNVTGKDIYLSLYTDSNNSVNGIFKYGDCQYILPNLGFSHDVESIELYNLQLKYTDTENKICLVAAVGSHISGYKYVFFDEAMVFLSQLGNS